MRGLEVTIVLAVALLCAACADERIYVGDEAIHQVAITPRTPPAIEGDEGALYVVETTVALRVREPSETERRDLGSGAGAYRDLPFPRLPWVERGDVELSIDFTLSNLDSESHDVDVTVNGGNEFDEYFPGVQLIDDVPVPLHAQWERRLTVPAKSRLARTVREEELDEAAVDLATVVNGAPNSDQVVYFENKSASDERSRRYIPEVIPGLLLLRLGLRADAPVPLLLEATVRARDVADKLADVDEPAMHLHPEPFMAVVPEIE